MSDDEYIILRRSEVELLVRVLTPLSHCWGGSDYNKWMHGGGSKKGKMTLHDASDELRKILPRLEKELDDADDDASSE